MRRARLPLLLLALGGCSVLQSELVWPADSLIEWADWPVPPEAPTDYFPEEETVIDNVTSLVWQRQVAGPVAPWEDAKRYCEELSLAGQSDWRLPTAIELLSLVDTSRVDPAINPTAFPQTSPGHYWSATPFAGDLGGYWSVSFGDGSSGVGAAEGTAAVRCVRLSAGGEE